MTKPILTVALFILSIGFVVSCTKESETDAVLSDVLPPLETVSFQLGGVEVEIEVAFRPNEQGQGLMYRESMPENHGMIFVNRQPRYLAFWMKNTLIPLSIAYIRDDLVISNIEEMKPQQGDIEPVERYYSKYKCLYALEMNEGWFEKHGIKEGDKIPIPLDEIEKVIAAKK